MADKTIFSRLRKLFSSNVIVRNVGGKKLKVRDTSRLQSVGNSVTMGVDRFSKLRKTNRINLMEHRHSKILLMKKMSYILTMKVWIQTQLYLQR